MESVILRKIQGEMILLEKQLGHYTCVLEEYLNHTCLIMYHIGSQAEFV